MLSNTKSLQRLAETMGPDLPEDLLEIHQSSSRARSAIRAAMRESLAHFFLHSSSLANAHYAVNAYQALCVQLRTHCEAVTPEFIEQLSTTV